MSLRKAAALMDCPDDDRGGWTYTQQKNISDHDTVSEQKQFRVPGLSSSDESSGSSSDDDGPSHAQDAPWRRRKKRHRPIVAPSQPYRTQSPMDAAAMMETEQPLSLSDIRENSTRRAPNHVWAAVLTDSVLDDAMNSQMRMFRSDRAVEAYAYRGPEARCGLGRPEGYGRQRGNNGGRRCHKPVLEEGELSDNDDEDEDEVPGHRDDVDDVDDVDDAEDDGEDSHSDSLSIDNNVDPGEFAREGFRGRYDMDEIEDMDTNSRSAPPGGLPSTSSGSAGVSHHSNNESVVCPADQSSGRKRPRKKRNSQNRSQAASHRSSAKSRLGKRMFDPSKSRPPFNLGPERSDEDVASAVAERLDEGRCDILSRCVRLLGREKVYHTLLTTEDLEEAGGLYVHDGSRRRTPGGVYFHLIKEDDQISAEHKRQIFAPTEEGAEAKKERKRRKRIAAARRTQRVESSSSVPGSMRSSSMGPVPPPDEWSSINAPFTVGPPAPPGIAMALSNLTPPHASTTSSSPPSSTLASTEAASSGKTPNNSPHPAPLEVDDF